MQCLKLILIVWYLFFYFINVKSYLWEFPPETTAEATPTTIATTSTTTTTYLANLNTTQTVLSLNKLLKLKKSSPVINDNQCNSNPCLVLNFKAIK